MGKTLNFKLQEARAELNMTQKEMAFELNISEPIYKFLEYGEVLWETEYLERRVDEIVENRRKHHSID